MTALKPFCVYPCQFLDETWQRQGGSRHWPGSEVLDSNDAPIRYLLRTADGVLRGLGMTPHEAREKMLMICAAANAPGADRAALLPPPLKDVPDDKLLTPSVAARVLATHLGREVSSQAVRHLCEQGDLAYTEVVVQHLERRITRDSLLELIRRGMPDRKGGRPRKNTMPEKIYIYNQNCTAAGQAVSQSVIDDYNGDPDDAGDWTSYTVDDLPYVERRAAEAGAGDDRYYSGVAATIRQAFGLDPE